MIVDKNGYLKIQEKINEQVRDLVSNDELDSFNKHIEVKLKDFKPALMIYGVYNAGKSTLLNALFGKEEMAKTGDAPETSKIHEYTYNGYTIFDTPGLNAKTEDDDTTKEHLNKSELIIFVMSNDGSLEEEYVYEKISEVVKAKKPIIIVLNNKSGIDMNSVESIRLIDKIGENLRKIGDRNKIDRIEDKVSLCQVNAKSALKAKLEHKNLILKKSNILLLEEMIENILEKAGSKEVINALNLYISNFINNVISKIDHKMDNIEVQKTEELITYLEKLKKSSEVKLKNAISSKMPTLEKTISSDILNGSDDIQSHIEATIETINSEITNIVNYIEKDLKVKVDEFTQEIYDLHVDYENFKHPDEDVSNKDNSEDSTILDTIKQKTKDVLKDTRVTNEGIKQFLTKAKELLPKKIMYGKGPVWISKTANKVAVGITIAMEAYNAYSAYQEHQAIIEEKRNRALSAKSSAESITNDIQNSLFASIDELTADIFNNLISNYRKLSQELGSKKNNLVSRKDELISILCQL
ncbi:50S ribosome-binding GTPase [Sulfurimonas sp. SWIR-19]|uniref:GTPase n=1 Tax=Sulfurimonas sp. SWIR-19 TaxID=2878390 RepID=UPI001CF3B225|nr:GTPase [Sulfurimonas sp. SWIR-19]UCN00123.1 50S ribosome-binding GTPase [Sulfurimonas sp. SWIR-19]